MATNFVADNFRGRFNSFMFYRNKEFLQLKLKSTPSLDWNMAWTVTVISY
jgi:hypothetical protein